jgi:hypothetical protein
LSFFLYATSCPQWWFLTYFCLFNFTGLMSWACTCIVWDHCQSWASFVEDENMLRRTPSLTNMLRRTPSLTERPPSISIGVSCGC